VGEVWASVVRDWRVRPWWMNLFFYFCIYMTFVYMPFDMFWKPVADDEEVWFGLVVYGWWAKLTEPIHWIIYGSLAYGFLRMKSWLWPWAAIYVGQVVISMLVWNLTDPRGGGLWSGLIAAGVFAVPMVALWRSKALFQET